VVSITCHASLGGREKLARCLSYSVPQFVGQLARAVCEGGAGRSRTEGGNLREVVEALGERRIVFHVFPFLSFIKVIIIFSSNFYLRCSPFYLVSIMRVTHKRDRCFDISREGSRAIPQL
jgi:hypothetical protein